MSRANPQATIVSEEQLVLRANRLVIKKNNQRIASDSDITDIMLRFTLGYDEDPKAKMTSLSTFVATRLRQPWRAILSVLNKSLTRKDTSWDTSRLPILQILWGIVHSANLDFVSLIWDEFEWKVVDRSTKPCKMSKLLYTCFTKLIIDYFLSCNKKIPRRSDSELHSEGDDSPLTKLLNTVKGTYMFGMEIHDTMINDAFKQSAGYKYYKAKKAESKKAKVAEESEEQNVSPVRSERGKGYMRLGDYEANVPKMFKKDTLPRKTRSLIVAEETFAVELTKYISIDEQRNQQRRRIQLTIDRKIDNDVADTYAEWGQKLKGPVVEDLAVQSLLDLRKGSKASRLERLRQKKQAVTSEGSSVAHTTFYDTSDTESDATHYSSCLDTSEESANETDVADDSDMDLTNDEQNGDDNTVRYGVFMYNKSTKTPKSIYFSSTVTSSSVDFIQNLLDETPVNELTDLMSNPVYTDTHTTSAVPNPKGNPEVRIFLSGSSEVPFGTHVDVQATKLVLHEIFLDDVAHHNSSLPANTTHRLPINPQLNSLQAKAKKLMQKAKKNIRKINFKKVVAQKFREYDQKLEALTNINVSEAFEKAVQERVLTEIKKLLPTHIPTSIANYVRPHLNTSVLEVMKNNQISLFTKSSTSADDLSEMDLKIKLLNRIYLNKLNDTYTTHQQLYDTLYESINLDQEAINAQDAEPSFHKRSHDNQDPPNDHDGEKRKKQRKDVGQSSSRSTRRNKSLVSGSAGAAKRRTTWFDLLLKSDIYQNKNHILGPSTIMIVKKLKAIIQKDEFTIADLKGTGLEKLKQQYKNDVELEYHVDQLKASMLSEAKWNSDEDDVSKPRSFERHMSKNTKPHPSFYNNDFYYLVSLSTKKKYTTSLTNHYAARYYIQGIEDMISDRWSKETHRYHFEALNGIHHWEDSKIDFFKAKMSNRLEGKVYSDLRIKSVVCIVVNKKWGYGFLTSIVVRRYDDKEYEFNYADLPRLSLNDVEDMYLLQVQDKLHHLPLEFVKDFNNSILLFIRRVVIQNRVEDIQLGVESY
ncbi:hypothetical protein Tco_1402748 [Tanacetum coccineum]